MKGEGGRCDVLVSVIIPAYDAEETLGRTLDSVLRQTHRRLEVLVVDDGSTDGTAEVAAKYESHDRRVRLIRRENGGVARARNTALKMARGDYVAWVDADDIWHPDKIDRQLRVFEEPGERPAFVYTGYRLIDETDRVLENIRPLTDVSGHTLCQQLATNFFGNVSSVIVPRALALQVGGHDPRLRDEGAEGAEDLLMQLRLAAIGPAKCCRAALVGYRMHPRNMSLDRRRAARSNLRALELIAAENQCIPDWVLRIGRARTVGYAAYCLFGGDLAGGLSLFWQLTRQQTQETFLITLRIVKFGIDWRLRSKHHSDSAVGMPFAQADPDTACWRDPILLSAAERANLADADDALVRCAVPT